MIERDAGEQDPGGDRALPATGGRPARGRDLATAPTGVPLRVGSVLFDVVRSRCRELGIRTGVRLRCVGRTDDHVRVRLADGGEAEIPLEHAQFVRISRESDWAAAETI